MEMRVAKLEMSIVGIKDDVDTLKKDMVMVKTDLALVKTDLAVIKSNYVTKGDLHEEMGKQTKWILTGFIGIAGLALAVARWLF